MKSSSLLVGRGSPLSKLPSTFPSKIDDQLSLGLDLGVGSCGQALVYDSVEAKANCNLRGLPNFPGRIAFLGVRAFDTPEVREKVGIRLKNPERRYKRRLRITTRRRASRLWEIRSLFKTHKLFPEDYPIDQRLWKFPPPRGENSTLDKWRDWHSRMTVGATGDGKPGPLELRVKALDHPLEPLELAAALLHIAKHRGFKSNRKSEALVDDGGKVLKALSENRKRMKEGSYRTFGEMLLKHPDFAARKRNREGVYTSTALRDEQEQEIRLLFKRQRELGNLSATPDLESAFIKLFAEQRPLQNSLKLIGDCPFEKGEKRGPRYAPSFELSRALQKLNTISIVVPNVGRIRLADYVEEKNGSYEDFIRRFPTFGTKTQCGRITWGDLRDIFQLPADVSFPDLPPVKIISKKDGTQKVGTAADLEKVDFVTRSNANGAAKGSFLLREALGHALYDDLFNSHPAQLDQVAFALTFFEQIENTCQDELYWGVLNQMRHDKLDARLLAAVEQDLKSDTPRLACFTGSTSMSTLASRRLIPLLRTGKIYSEACTKLYGDHRQTDFPFESITNPIVKSVVRECLKQIVHLIQQTGALPGRICVEIGRDLGKSVTERNEMRRGIDERTETRNTHRTTLKTHLNRDPDDHELLRYELWLEQSHICPYCGHHLGKPIDIITPEFEVDHILPRSRSHDNSYENKILVHRRCNREKANATPFEFSRIGNGDARSEGWIRFTTTVAALKGIRKQKRRNLLNTSFAENEPAFLSRHLNDTRYIARLVTHYLQALYVMADEIPAAEKGGARRVFVQPGALTALVRKSWGLENLKKDLAGNRIGDKHHAIDALVCALLSEGQRQLVTRLEQQKTNTLLDIPMFGQFARAYHLMEQHNDHNATPRDVEPPWEGFRHDVARAVDLFNVSRRETRKGRGSLHNDTVYRVESGNGGDICYSRKSIIDSSVGKGKPILKSISDLDKVKDIHLDRNRWLKDALTAWIESGCPVAPEALPRDPQGATIRKVTICQGKKSGRMYPQGFVTEGTQVRLDVFSKPDARGKTKYFLVPVYAYHLNQPQPPNLAIVANVHEKNWQPIDGSYRFQFSLWPNSLFKIEKKPSARKPGGESVKGLYSGINRNTGAFEYCDPNDSRIKGSASAKTGASVFCKIQIDRLGREFIISAEKRTWRGATVD